MTLMEKRIHESIENYLHLQLRVLFKAHQLYINLETALGDLRGKHDPKTKAIHYPNFVALNEDKGKPPKVYSFEIHPGENGKRKIRIFENTGEAEIEMLSVLSNGFMDFSQQDLRHPIPSAIQVVLGNKLISKLRTAAEDSEAYTQQLDPDSENATGSRK